MIYAYHFTVHPATHVQYRNSPLAGATVKVDIKVFNGTEEITLYDGICVAKNARIYHLSDLVEVHFDHNQAIQVQINGEIKDLYLKGYSQYGITKIEFSIPPDGYYIDVGISDGVCVGWPVTEAEFKDFLKAHADLFDIPENQRAQVL